MKIKQVNPSDSDFKGLESQLIQELAILDGNDSVQNTSINKADDLFTAIIAYENNEPIACGACRKTDAKTMEIKRMFVVKKKRNSGIGKLILNELENIGRSLNIHRIVLETGKNQPDAIAFYSGKGYLQTANFGPYVNSANSVCFLKLIH